QGDESSLALVYTGGDESTKIATITSLPAEGTLYQYSSEGFGPEITTVPTALTDASHRLFYSADGGVGNGEGNFEFTISDDTNTSEAAEYVVNVTPPGIPNFLQAAKQSDRIEITFDRDMGDPTGKHLEFSVQDGGVDITPVSCFLKPGDPSTIVVTVGSVMNTSNALAVAYTKGTVLASSGGVLETFDFQIAGKLVQTIDFDVLADKVFGDPTFEYVATTSSGLPVVFSSSNSTIVSLTSSNAAINNAGECIITATQAGNSEYSAVSFERVQVVSPANGTVSLEDLERDYTGGALNASASTEPAGLDVTFLYDGSSTPPTDLGVYTVVASINGGNYQGSVSGSFEISDLSAPVADVADLPNVSGECSASADAPSATDLLEGAITATTTTEFPVYESTDVTWKFVDSSGNESTQVQSIVIADVTAPEAPVLGAVVGECSVTAVAPMATDACAGEVLGTTADELTKSTVGTHEITWTFDDGRGNSIQVVQEVIVTDATEPEMPTLSSLSGECSVTAEVPTTMDDCVGVITGTTSDDLTKSTVGTHEITWTFDDGHGNAIDVVQEVTVLDSTEPEMPSLSDLSGECSVTATVPTTMDDCAGLIAGTTSDELTKTTVGTHEITWTFDDGHGNAFDVVQEVTVLDSTLPETPNLSVVSGECSVTAEVPTTMDDCAGVVIGTTSDELTKSTVGTHEITWTFDDGHGNAFDVVQEVVVLDSVEPEVPTLSELSGECSVTASVPTAIDDCSGVITGTTSDELTKTTAGSHEITWTFDDGHGNAVDVVQVVTVVDSTEPEMPALSALSGECSVTAEVPTTMDDCVGLIIGTTPDELTKTTVGTHEITWTFDDGNGNAINVVQEVEVIDSTEPAMPNLSAQSGECSVTVIAPNTFDECRGMIAGTTNDPTTYTEVGHHEITWTFDDGNGNSIETVQDVVVEDTTPPEMPTLAAVSGVCSVTAEAPTTFDDCAGEIVGVTYDQATQTVAGTHEITWYFN
ncbi:MAG: MBG domain-containing protein, partial [Flavobacteriales bacterium]